MQSHSSPSRPTSGQAVSMTSTGAGFSNCMSGDKGCTTKVHAPLRNLLSPASSSMNTPASTEDAFAQILNFIHQMTPLQNNALDRQGTRKRPLGDSRTGDRSQQQPSKRSCQSHARKTSENDMQYSSPTSKTVGEKYPFGSALPGQQDTHRHGHLPVTEKATERPQHARRFTTINCASPIPPLIIDRRHESVSSINVRYARSPVETPLTHCTSSDMLRDGTDSGPHLTTLSSSPSVRNSSPRVRHMSCSETPSDLAGGAYEGGAKPMTLGEFLQHPNGVAWLRQFQELGQESNHDLLLNGRYTEGAKKLGLDPPSIELPSDAETDIAHNALSFIQSHRDSEPQENSALLFALQSFIKRIPRDQTEAKHYKAGLEAHNYLTAPVLANHQSELSPSVPLPPPSLSTPSTASSCSENSLQNDASMGSGPNRQYGSERHDTDGLFSLDAFVAQVTASMTELKKMESRDELASDCKAKTRKHNRSSSTSKMLNVAKAKEVGNNVLSASNASSTGSSLSTGAIETGESNKKSSSNMGIKAKMMNPKPRARAKTTSSLSVRRSQPSLMLPPAETSQSTSSSIILSPPASAGNPAVLPMLPNPDSKRNDSTFAVSSDVAKKADKPKKRRSTLQEPEPQTTTTSDLQRGQKTVSNEPSAGTNEPQQQTAKPLARSKASAGRAKAKGSPSTAKAMTKAERDAKKVIDRRRRRRESHNAVERRRRDLINERIAELAILLPEAMLLEAVASSTGGGTAPHIDLSIFAKSCPCTERKKAITASSVRNAVEHSDHESSSVNGISPPSTSARQARERGEALLDAVCDGTCSQANEAALELAQSKPNKGVVLTKAVEYIKHLHEICAAMRSTNVELQDQLDSIRRTILGGSSNSNTGGGGADAATEQSSKFFAPQRSPYKGVELSSPTPLRVHIPSPNPAI